MKKGLTYKEAGVDINKADKLVKSYKAIAKKTHIPGNYFMASVSLRNMNSICSC